MKTFELEIHRILERMESMSADFDALKASTERLLAAYKAEVAKNQSPPPAPDPAPADIASLQAEIDAVLPPV